MSRLKFLLITTTLFFQMVKNTEFMCDYDEQHKWYVLGIYSACYNKTNRSEQNILAEELDRTVKMMWELKSTGYYEYSSFNLINVAYISIDICEDFNQLPKIIEMINLNETFHYETWSQKSNKSRMLSSIFAIYAEVPMEMMNYLTASFEGDFRFTGKHTSFNSSTNREQYEIYASITKYIIQHRLKWERLLILQVQPSIMQPLYETLTKKVIETKLCVQYKKVDLSWNITQEDYFTAKWFEENKPAVIILGSKFGQIEIVKQLSTMMKNNKIRIPILAEGFTNIMYKYHLAPKNFDCFRDVHTSLLTMEFSAFSEMEINLMKSDAEIFHNISLMTNKTISFNQQHALVTSLQFVRIYKYNQCQCPLDFDCIEFLFEDEASIIKYNWDRIFNPFLDTYSVQVKFLDLLTPFDEYSFERYHSGEMEPCRRSVDKRQYYSAIFKKNSTKDPCLDYFGMEQCWEGLPDVENTQCPVLHCKPGFYKSYEKIAYGFSWICKPCAKDHFKADSGNHQCTPCVGRLSIDNGKRTACVDPYTNVFLDYTSKEFYIVESISLLVLIVVAATFITFIKNRNTPMVRTSDFKISILHMLINAFILIATPLVYFTNHICITKPLTLTTLYTINIGIVFIKSQKILKAFLSEVRITSKEAKRTSINQVFIVMIFISSVNIIFFVSYYQLPIQVLAFDNPAIMTRELVCSTYFHNTIVMIAIAVIQLMCAIQAFRGRNLPSVMNDGVILMYATFILTVSFIVCFIIVPFQKPIEKGISQCIALLVNTMVIMFLLYGQKAYRILFFPEQNTRAYFRHQSLKGMKHHVNHRIEMK